MKNKWFVCLCVILISGFVLTGCDTGGNSDGEGNVTMILVNNHAATITRWEFFNDENLSPSSQNFTILSGESKTISLTMKPPFVIEQIYITAGGQECNGMVDFSPDDTTSTVTLTANGGVVDNT
jgi:hypothetical protein